MARELQTLNEQKNGTVGRTSRGVQEQWVDGKRLVQGKSES